PLSHTTLELFGLANLAFVPLAPTADQPHTTTALDCPLLHVAPRHCANLGYSKSLAHLGPAQISFLDDGLEQSSHGFFDLVLKLVDDRVQADIYLLHFRQLLRLALRPDVEADNHRIRG